MSQNKSMIFTAVDQMYAFSELEEYAREGIVYDIMTKLEISEDAAIKIAEDKTYLYDARIKYDI